MVVMAEPGGVSMLGAHNGSNEKSTRSTQPATAGYVTQHQVHPPVIAIFGPTGTGKTGAAVNLALRFNGEVVNADSRYLYRHFEIGVAKPTLEERKGVRHHLIDICEPTDVITIAEIQKLAYQAFDEITAARKLPIVVGGTPLYMNAITEGWSMPEVAPDWEFRSRMEATAAERGADWLADQVRAIDPVVADRPPATCAG